MIFQSAVSDEIGLARVEWWLDGSRIGSRPQAPFIQQWTALSGEHSLFMRAYDLAGNMTQSETITFSVGQ